MYSLENRQSQEAPAFPSSPEVPVRADEHTDKSLNVSINILLEYLTFIHCLPNKPGGFIPFHLKQHILFLIIEYFMSIILLVE